MNLQKLPSNDSYFMKKGDGYEAKLHDISTFECLPHDLGIGFHL